MPAFKKKLRLTDSGYKAWKIALSVFLFLIVLIGGGILYWNTHKKAIIRKKLENAVTRRSHGLYKIKYENLEMDELAGRLSIINLQLYYDTSIYLKQVSSGDAPSLLLMIQVPEITVSGIITPRALIEKEIIGQNLVIKNPVINLMYTYSGSDSGRKIPVKELYQQVLGSLDLIILDSVKISGAQICTSNYKTGSEMVSLNELNVSLVDVKVDGDSFKDSSRLLFAKECRVECGTYTGWSSNRLYFYRAKRIALNTIPGKLLIDSFSIKPTLSEKAFAQVTPREDERLDFSFSQISLEGIDMQKLVHGNLSADDLVVKDAIINVYRDLNWPVNLQDHINYYPHQVIDRIPFPFNIRKVNFIHSFVEYKELNNITRRPGRLQFYKTSAVFSNFTNDKEVLALNNVMTIDIQSRFLNKTSFNTYWKFYLGNPEGRFEVQGNAGSMQAAGFNVLTEPMGQATMKSGQMRGLQFSMSGFDYGMSGTVKLLYNGLKIILLEKDRGAPKADKKFLSSFIANLIIINDNPTKNDPVRTVQVSFQKDTSHSIFYLCWNTLFKGIRETVGIKK